MLSLRRSALRVLTSSPSTFTSKPRTITSLSQSFLQSKPAAQSLFGQRRWASDVAQDQEAPVSKLQPTAEEEVNNAIQEDAAEAVTGAATEAQSDDIPVPLEPPAPESAAKNVYSSPRPSPQEAGRAVRIAQPKPSIYIGNLFFDVTEDDLKKEFSSFGPIEQVRLLRDGRGLSKGFGYIDFQDTESATAAINARHQQVFEGRRLVVQYAAYTTKEIHDSRAKQARGPSNPPSRTIFIGNMSYEMTDRDLNNLFRGIRNVIDVRVAIDRRTGQPRGFAHADFIDVKSAVEGMKVLAEKESYGRKLRLDFGFASSAAPKNQVPPPSPPQDQE